MKSQKTGILTQPSPCWNQAVHKPQTITGKKNTSSKMFFFCCVLQLLQVFSYLGCLGQRGRIQQVNLHRPQPCIFDSLNAYPLFQSSNPSRLSFFFAAHVSVKNNSGVKPAGQCGTWVKEPEGGLFTSPNFTNKYPPDTECVYILEGKYSL